LTPSIHKGPKVQSVIFVIHLVGYQSPIMEAFQEVILMEERAPLSVVRKCTKIILGG
jgi:hypothetical protein